MKKLLLYTVLTLTLVCSTMAVTFAADRCKNVTCGEGLMCNPDTGKCQTTDPNTHFGGEEGNKTLIETTFDISKNLNLEEGQDYSYFDKNSKYSPIVNFILYIINFATKVIGSFALIMFIVAGFIYLISQGNQQQLDKAKEVWKYAAIGMIVTFFSYTIMVFIQSIFTTND